VALLDSTLVGPVNIGSPDERTMLELADVILEMSGSDSGLEFLPLPTDDPLQRCPDITLATTALGWVPKVDLREGIARTIEYLSPRVGRS
jgi:nucleoside-diphosphate-sugar epimerase